MTPGDPSQFPECVLSDSRLTKRQKSRILHDLEEDQISLLRATDENMRGKNGNAEAGDLLRKAKVAEMKLTEMPETNCINKAITDNKKEKNSMTSTDLLKSFLGDTYALMIKTHFFHWNVMGPEFSVLHAMFEKQYTDLFEAADVVAERVRALGDHPPGGAKAFAQMTSVEDPKLGLDASGILDVLIRDHKNLAEHAKKWIKVANQANDDVTADLLIGRVQEHEKQIWMMNSMRKAA